jgi:hypothetical protein
MSTEWFNRRVGEAKIKELPEGGYMTVIGTPDWVSLPEQLGGGKARVEREHHGRCPCGDGHIVRRLELKNGMGVAECEHIGFAWYEKEGDKDD